MLSLQSAYIPICTPQTGGGRHTRGDLLQDNLILIELESTEREGDTLVPLVLTCCGTHLSSFAGDKPKLPVYTTTGNLYSKICQMPSMPSIGMVRLLLPPMKNWIIGQTRLDHLRQTYREVQNGILLRVLQPLTFKLNPSAASGY